VVEAEPIFEVADRVLGLGIRKALGDATRWGKISRNPAELADPPKLRASKRLEMKTWDATELCSFLNFAQDDDLYPAWHLDANTGLRRGELVGLRWSDLDLDAAQLSVRRALVSVNYEIEFEEPKTARAPRTVALDASTVKVLKEHRKNQLEQRLAAGTDYSVNDLVFFQADGSPIHPQVASDRFARIVERAGLPRISLKGLRHTHATLALKAGVPVKVVSERLGHASTSFTMDTYAHVLPGMQEDAAEMVAGLVAGSGVEPGSKSGRSDRPEAEE
jgi:integrase